jgi:hypothetical protein
VLHPGRYAASDAPLDVAFPDSSADVMYEDTLGELEIQILLAVLRGGSIATVERPIGWGGDRYRVVRTLRGPALEWITVWDVAPGRPLPRSDGGSLRRPAPARATWWRCQATASSAGPG